MITLITEWFSFSASSTAPLFGSFYFSDFFCVLWVFMGIAVKTSMQLWEDGRTGAVLSEKREIYNSQ